MSGQRQAVFPTRMALTTLKQRNLGAKKGYELLKKKSDALMLRLRGILKEIKQVRPTRGRLWMLVLFFWRTGFQERRGWRGGVALGRPVVLLNKHTQHPSQLATSLLPHFFPGVAPDQGGGGKGDAGRHILYQ